MAGPYSSVSEARGMASPLAHFDWAKEVENFSDEEIRMAVRLANQYRADIEFARHLKRITAT